LVLIFEWETVFPTIIFFPVNSQTLDIVLGFSKWSAKVCINF